jgi:hypothetical protein
MSSENGLLKYSREQIQQFIKDGVSSPKALRDYDIVKAKMAGKKIDDIMFETNACRTQIFDTLKRYGVR